MRKINTSGKSGHFIAQVVFSKKKIHNFLNKKFLLVLREIQRFSGFLFPPTGREKLTKT